MWTGKFFLWHQCFFSDADSSKITLLRLQHSDVGKCWMLWLSELNIHLQQDDDQRRNHRNAVPESMVSGKMALQAGAGVGHGLLLHGPGPEPARPWLETTGLLSPGSHTPPFHQMQLLKQQEKNNLLVIISFMFLGILFLARTLLDQLYYSFPSL